MFFYPLGPVGPLGPLDPTPTPSEPISPGAAAAAPSADVNEAMPTVTDKAASRCGYGEDGRHVHVQNGLL